MSGLSKVEGAAFRAYAKLNEGQGALACGGTPSSTYPSSLRRLAQGRGGPQGAHQAQEILGGLCSGTPDKTVLGGVTS